ELRQTQLQNCSVKAYVFKQNDQGEVITESLRLQNPDDSLPLQNLWLALPNVIVHRIDAFSPFLPVLDRDALGGGIHSAPTSLVQMKDMHMHTGGGLQPLDSKFNNIPFLLSQQQQYMHMHVDTNFRGQNFHRQHGHGGAGGLLRHRVLSVIPEASAE
ncbi:unnamed protein product, partial [Amoebophrya sp. A25]